MGPRRELADEMQRQRDAAEAEMREALGKLVAQRISSKVECESVMQTTDGAFEVHLAVDACDYDWHLPEPPQGEFKLSWERCPHRYAWQATARIPVAGAAQVLRDALGDEALAALQPKLEVRDGVATITRKTLRKDGGG
jgi:hypothetical protein